MKLLSKKIRAKFGLQQAKVAQELAIAQRILNADTVEIEEFYSTVEFGGE